MITGEKQEKFSFMMTKLLVVIHAAGYSVRGGHWMRCRGCHVGMDNSLHMDKLAFDINLSLSPADGERPRYLTGTAAEKAHNKFHDVFDKLGGARRIPGDLNHYSMEHCGRR